MNEGPGDEQSNPESNTDSRSLSDQPRSDQALSDQPLSADSAARGWVVPPGGSQVDALFLIASGRLGIGRSESSDAPIWFDLSKVAKLDALGEPGDDNGLIHIEMVMDDETVVAAGWPESFCDAVVTALKATQSIGVGTTPESGESAFSVEPVIRNRSRRRNTASETVPPVEATPAAEMTPLAESVQPAEPSTPTAAASPQASDSEGRPGDSGSHSGSRSAALELEDVTYLGGFPGQTKRRKRCVATLTMEGLEVTGPTDLAVRIAWTSVNSIETQNSDEARFRTNTKIHRDSSALVIACEDGVTLMLEARDCPTVPLRSAITQLLGDLSVVVV